MFARLSALKRSNRLRAIGWIVLTSGLAGAAVLYWIQSRSADLEMNDLNALGYTKSMQHGMGVMMGPLGHADRLAARPGEPARSGTDARGRRRAGGRIFLSSRMGTRRGG